jgi:type IV secretion system protein VirB5
MKPFKVMSMVFGCGAALMLAAAPARAGIPVIDAANLAQSVQSVINEITQIENQVTQIQTATQHLQSINGIRGLANMANSTLLHNYIPTTANQTLQSIDSVGFSGLTGTGRQLRSANATYNCASITDPTLNRLCQTQLARPYQQKGFLADALQTSSNRMPQIDVLMQQSSSAPDQQARLEANGRLEGESAMLLHENTQAQLLAAQIANEQQIAASQANERMLERSSRTGQLASFVKF